MSVDSATYSSEAEVRVGRKGHDDFALVKNCNADVNIRAQILTFNS